MKLTYESQKILGKLFRMVSVLSLGWPELTLQVTPDPHFKPCDVKELGYPVDPRISELPIYDTLLERLKPIKKAYEHSLSWDMRRYRVLEPEIPSGVAIKNKRRKRARDQNLNVSSAVEHD
jgi:RNA-dependent RNA polymerase